MILPAQDRGPGQALVGGPAARRSGEECLPHDHDRVEYDAPEFDGPLGAPGLHRVPGPVRAEARATVLPPDLFERFAALTFWNDPTGTSAWRIAPEAKKGA
jgi:hypothetical protein